MLRRGDSDASNRLRRAKSASSVQERRKNPVRSEPIDPETAQLYAVVAAHRAMERSSERASDELRRSGSSASKNQAAGQGFNRAHNVRFSATAELRRQRSRVQLRSQAPPSIASTLYVPTEVSNTYVDENPYISSPTHGLEFGRTENYGAEPSSYRRLRKAKSMLTPRRRPISVQDPTSPASPVSTSRRLRSVDSSFGLGEHGLKVGLKRSMSFLRPPGSITKAFKRPEPQPQSNEEAVQIARTQYLKDLEERAGRATPSLLFHPKIRHQQKAFRRSVRTSRLTDFGNGVKSENQHELEDKPESKMRTISASFRDKVMRVFGRSMNDKYKLPAQQLDASRQYFRDYVDGSATDGDAFDHYHSGDPDSSSRRSLYIPTQQEHDTLEDLDKMSAKLQSAASRESLHSAARSRVTSWTNSTVTGSLAIRSATPLERKRLSIIKEDGGPHQPSSSAGRHLGGVNLFQEPMGPPVDSQRIYSALMRRIDQEQDEMDRAQKELDEIHQERQAASKQAWRNTTTIRPVRSETSLLTIAPDHEYREFSVGVPTWEEQAGVMTPERHQENVERRKKRLEVQEAQSSFFPFSTSGGERKIATTPSPFKLALLERRKEMTEEDAENEIGAEEEEVSVVHHKTDETASRLARQLGLGRGRFGMRSDDSVYSRTTNGGSNPVYVAPIGSSDDIGFGLMAENNSGESAGLGMATIIPTRVNRYQYPRPTERVGSLQRQRSQAGSSAERGSTEWRGWLEREVRFHSQSQSQSNDLERQGSHTSSRSHVRENAQIDGSDVEVGSGENVKRFPLLELKEVSRGNTPVPKRSGSGHGLVKSQSGLLLKRNSMGLLSGETNDENKKLESTGSGKVTLSWRKVSPSNVAKLLKGKTGMHRFSGGGKDNESVQAVENLEGNADKNIQGDEPPVSTPGRLMMVYGGSVGRKKVDEEVTPTGAGTRRKKGQYRFQHDHSEQDKMSDREDEGASPEGSAKTNSTKNGLFAARLSRPFDMDVPGHNRPYDSMFLGKGKDLLGLGLPSDGNGSMIGGTGGGRLSVASVGMGTRFGAVGAQLGGSFDGTLQAVERGGGVNTPVSTSTSMSIAGGATKGFGLGMSSRRMVSNFLRSRRRNESPALTQDEDKSLGGSPAFI